jgi:tetratricopeptide (TPR) repeat protein
MTKDSANYVYAQKRIQKQNRFPVEKEIMAEMTTYNENMSMASLIEESMNKKDQIQNFSVEHEKMQAVLFNHFWLTDKYSAEDLELLKLIFTSEEIQFADKCIIVSAITISLMRDFDENKFNILLDVYNDNDEQVSQRALAGFILCSYWHNSRMKLYTKLMQRVELFVQQQGVTDNIRIIIIQFIKSMETEKITKKIKEEFIPEIAKISPILQDKIKLDDLMKDENSLFDKNPDWQDLFDKSGVTDKIQEFAELQQSGADVYMSTFSSMKSYPFFYDMCNWFIPFYNHSTVVNFFNENKKSPILQVFMNSQFLCNSDKYSLLFSLMQMPQQYKDMMMQSINVESEQLEELQNNRELTTPSKKRELISNQYIQDIYRFFKLHPRKSDFVDPFHTQLNLHNLSFFNELVDHEKILRTIGENYFKQDHYEESAKIFEQLLKTDTSNIELYQKIGYSYQRLGDYKKAISFYEKAETLKTDNLWNLRKIAFCYRSIKETELALIYYQRAEKMAPEDLSIQLAIGHCFLEQKRYNDALQVFFKIEYLKPGNEKVWRPIAWCSFVEGKFDQAEKYYDLWVKLRGATCSNL